jgi:hypothetical protein
MLNENGRTLAGVIAELKDELKEFLQTRLSMLRSELRDKAAVFKLALPLLAVALLLLGTAWLVLTAALISIIAGAFSPSPFAYFFAFIIVGVAYALAGAICGTFGYRELKENRLVPERTLRVLKQDQLWLQTEARSQL